MDIIKFRTINNIDIYLRLYDGGQRGDYISLITCYKSGVPISFGFILDINTHDGTFLRYDYPDRDIGISLDKDYKIEIDK